VNIGMARTSHIGEVLYIPIAGVLQVFQRDVEPFSLLNDSGKYICVHVGSKVHVHFRAVENGVPNTRAAYVLATLTDVHMVITGAAVFDGLGGDRIYEIIQTLSKEGA
jgi:hypothetical protein